MRLEKVPREREEEKKLHKPRRRRRRLEQTSYVDPSRKDYLCFGNLWPPVCLAVVSHARRGPLMSQIALVRGVSTLERGIIMSVPSVGRCAFRSKAAPWENFVDVVVVAAASAAASLLLLLALEQEQMSNEQNFSLLGRVAQRREKRERGEANITIILVARN